MFNKNYRSPIWMYRVSITIVCVLSWLALSTGMASASAGYYEDRINAACYEHELADNTMTYRQHQADQSTGFRRAVYISKINRLYESWRITGTICFSN